MTQCRLQLADSPPDRSTHIAAPLLAFFSRSFARGAPSWIAPPIAYHGRETRCVRGSRFVPERLVFLSQSMSLLEVPEAIDLLRQHGLRPVTEVAPGRHGDVVAVILGVKPFGPAEAAPYPSLRTVARFGAGYDNVAVDALWRERRITVSYTPDVSTVEVAQFALAMIILTLRGATRDAVGLVAGRPWRYIGRGLGMAESTVGLLGCGHIGLETARLVAPLAKKTVLWRRTPTPIHLPGIDPSRYETVQDLNELATRCDGISVHLALTAQTCGIVGASFFEQVSAAGRSIALVNTARGGIVDETALLDALNRGIVRDAAIDVWSTEGEEPTEIVRALQHHPSVLPTTHIGAYTRGVQRRCAMKVATNIVAAVRPDPGK